MNLRNSLCAVLFLAVSFVFNFETFAQVYQRPRVVQTGSSQPSTQTTSSSSSPTTLIKSTASSRPTLTNDIRLADAYQKPLVKKTAAASAPAPVAPNMAISPAVAAFNQKMTHAMDSRLGIRYVYGSNGPNSYDCSSLVWAVFQEAGINFDRSSAANYWREFQPVTGDERFKFGTLVFFNGLGHVGIVVNEKGFYHASSSKGVTYSSFDGYWGKRIVGFRRIPVNIF